MLALLTAPTTRSLGAAEVVAELSVREFLFGLTAQLVDAEGDEAGDDQRGQEGAQVLTEAERK
jgi:hypothetical protein